MPSFVALTGTSAFRIKSKWLIVALETLPDLYSLSVTLQLSPSNKGEADLKKAG